MAIGIPDLTVSATTSEKKKKKSAVRNLPFYFTTIPHTQFPVVLKQTGKERKIYLTYL